MRITNSSVHARALERLQARLRAFDDAQQRVATGKAVSRPSDDPGAMESAMSLRSTKRAREQQLRSAEDGLSWVRLADSRLQGAVTALQRVRELALRAANAVNPSERNAIESEIRELRSELESAANATHQGVALFGGTVAGPVVVRSGGWSYTGTTTPLERRIADDDVVTVSVTAASVFGFDAGDDTFTMLDSLGAAVAAGDQSGIQSGIAGVDRALDRVLAGLGTIGASANRIEKAIARNVDESFAIAQQISGLEDVTFEQAVSELKLQEVGYQATLSAMARVLPPSLADFLR